MKRSAVFVGVDATGDLPKLKDAASGARKMESWAQGQGIDHIEVLTDEGDETVTASDIWAAVDKAAQQEPDQLLLYFAGHGVMIGRNEYWLLSGAPGNPNEAINVRGSRALAEYCGTPHVIFISDACRTAASGIAAGSVTGSTVFRNDNFGGQSGEIDLFYGCKLGLPAAEIPDPNDASESYFALYTTLLLEALMGEHPTVVDWEGHGAGTAFVRSKPLKAFLHKALTQRILDLDLVHRINQEPDALVMSGDDWWLSSLDPTTITGLEGTQRSAQGGSLESLSPDQSSSEMSSMLVGAALGRSAGTLDDAISVARSSRIPGISGIADLVSRIAQPFGPGHHESMCGFKVRGARIVAAHAANAGTTLFQSPGDVLRVDGMARPGSSILLELEQGTGVLLPALPGYLGALTFEGGEFVDLAYEPSENSDRWPEYQNRAGELRELRAVVAASVSRGVFRLERENALETSIAMQYAKGVDPSLAIYAAYAYADLNRHDLIQDMHRHLEDDLSGVLFDVAMLSRELVNVSITPNLRIFSPFPLLTQGWALLSAHRIQLPPSLAELQSTLAIDSVWTMFDRRGIDLVRQAFQHGEIR